MKFIISACIPIFISSILNQYIDSHLIKYYLENMESKKLGMMTTLIGSIQFFFDVFLGQYTDNLSNRFGESFLIKTGSFLISLSNILLFIPPKFIKDSNLLNFWFLIFKLISNFFPLEIIYNRIIQNWIEKSENKDNENIFAMKHFFSLFGSLFGSIIPIFLNTYSHFVEFYIIILNIILIISYWNMSNIFKDFSSNIFLI
jgi:hypothetical protein